MRIPDGSARSQVGASRRRSRSVTGGAHQEEATLGPPPFGSWSSLSSEHYQLYLFDGLVATGAVLIATLFVAKKR